MTGVTNKTAGAIAYQGFREIYGTLKDLVCRYEKALDSLSGEISDGELNLSESGQDGLNELQEILNELTDLREAVMWREIMFRPENGELKR